MVYFNEGMKTIILCGGKGSRLAEETYVRPKPMIPIGGRPILWHIMSTYGSYGFNDFILALGYKADFIKEYFLNYATVNSDFRVNLGTGEITPKKRQPRNWNVDLIDTGQETMTGGRLLRLKEELASEPMFMLTYGDGVADVDIKKLVEFHKSHGKIATVTAVKPSARFGGMSFEGDQVADFREKPQSGEGWINGGFFVFSPKIFSYLEDDASILERAPLEQLTKSGELMAFRHDGFWQCMDTIRDHERLEEIWKSGDAPWKKWD